MVVADVGSTEEVEAMTMAMVIATSRVTLLMMVLLILNPKPYITMLAKPNLELVKPTLFGGLHIFYSRAL